MKYDEIKEMKIVEGSELEETVNGLKQSLSEALKRMIEEVGLDVDPENIKFVGTSFHFVVKRKNGDYYVLTDRVLSEKLPEITEEGN